MARDNLTILEARYKNGDALVIEYLDAQIDLANAELQLADVDRAAAAGVARAARPRSGIIVGVDHELTECASGGAAWPWVLGALVIVGVVGVAGRRARRRRAARSSTRR